MFGARNPTEKFQHDVRQWMKKMVRENNLGRVKLPYVPADKYDPGCKDGGHVMDVAYELLRDAGHFGEERKRG